MVSTSTRDGPSTIPPSPNRRNPDVDSNPNFDHNSLTPTFHHHHDSWGHTEEERAHHSTSPRVQSPCVLCEKEGHPTNQFPSLPEVCNLIQLPQATTSSITSSTTSMSPTTSSKGLQTKFTCVICSEYGHYTHHFPALPQFLQMLTAIRQSFQQEPPPSTSSQNHITNIHYVMTSVNEWMRYP